MPNDLEPKANDLPTSPQLTQLMESAVARHEAAENENTARSYEAGWRQFERFCEAHRLRALPASPQSVTLFVERLAGDGYAVSTIDARLSAIAHYHAEAGLKNPCTSQPVRRQKKNVRRTTDTAPDQKAPVLMKHLRKMDFDEGELSDLRDQALLFVGFAGGFRRSELTALTAGDVREVPGGRVIRLRRSKTDQEGRGRLVQIPDRVALDPTPNEALEQWLRRAGISSGPLFRGVDRWGNIRNSALSGQAIYSIVRRRMESIGEDPDRYGAHSLRAGYATQGYLDGIGEHEIAEQTGHAKLDTLRSYQRVNVVLESHPLSRMGREE